MRIVINKTKDGCAFTIRARYSGAGITQLTQGGGISLPQEYWRYMKRIEIIKRRRSEVERIRRHLYGDAGAKFGAKEFYVDVNGICPTITTAPDHDIQLLEVIYE